ncbi:glycosyltransferase family 39 protein [Cetobacterium sp. 2A]|uniref:ArnT family glycosyltransferase n=1 Tax=Cetobacterium sp. 2A TaxID=2754723 RepID=UPI00163BAD38|nr:glycosyltransferase family 39 protein [Cetobacterium sp. 2A]MBC2856864.1 glycosyltransferase family 39 protein [Cetobacterium sp. 2A]
MVKTIKNEKIQLLVLGITSLFSFLSTLWVRGADLMEARNFITAREILESGNWMLTTLNGQYRFEKPPLPTWLTAIVMKMFNTTTNEAVLRIPSALISTLMVFLLYKLIKLLSKNSLVAFFSAFVLSTTFMVIKVGGENTWDIYPYAFIIGTIAYLIEGFEIQKLKSFIISGLFLGASIMSKGPVAIYGIFLPFILAYSYVYNFKNFVYNWKKIILLIVTGIVFSAIWPALMLFENHELFLSVLQKEADTWTTKHSRPIYFYLDYFVYTGVWIFFSIFSIFGKKYITNEIKNKKIFNFGFFWTLLTLLFLSVVKMKKQRYGIPIYITSSIMVGTILEYYYFKNWNILNRFDKLLFKIQAIFLSVVYIGVPILFITAFNKKIIKIDYLIFLMVIYGSLSIILFYMYKQKKNFIKFTIIATGFTMVLANITSNWYIERYLRSNYQGHSAYLEIFQDNKLRDPIYAKNFGIQDVWNIGDKIIQVTDNTIFPEKFIFLDSNNMSEYLSDNYKILKSETYYRMKDDDKTLNIYYMENK